MIERYQHVGAILALLEHLPVVGIVGARQVGKTTLAEQIGARYPGPVTRFDLVDLADLARLSQPELALGSL